MQDVTNLVTKAQFEAHRADYTLQIPYVVTSGSANSYTASTDPALAELEAGIAIAIKIHAANTGASTLNWNGKGAKSIKKANGSDIAGGNLKKDGVYTLRYDGSSFILQGEGGEYGTATKDQVLSGYTLGTEEGIVSGTINSKGAQIYTPGKTNQIISSGLYLAGNQTIKGDENLTQENIVVGKTIFNVMGDAFILPLGNDFDLSYPKQATVGGTTSYVLLITMTTNVNAGGTLRLSCELLSNGGIGSTYYSFRKNGIQFTEKETGIYPQQYTDYFIDLKVTPGDVITVYGRGATVQCPIGIKNARFTVGKVIVAT